MPIPSHPVSHPGEHKRLRALLALCVLGACLALAACGSSGSGSSSAAKTSAASTGRAGGPNTGRFTALRSCLAKQGITLPTRPSGAKPQPGGPAGAPGGGRGAFQLPKGVTRSEFQAALKKCGAGGFPGRGANAFNSASARAALVKYAACLRQNGIDVPAPNTTGHGPVFSTKGLDTSSAKFKTAQSKCRSLIKGAFGGGAGATPPAGAPNGTPPPGAGAPPSGAAPPVG